MSTTAPALADRDTFLEAVRAAGLLTPHQQQKAATATVAGPAADAARALVGAGLLTRFQADRVLAGRTDGFQLGPYVILDQVGRGSMSRVYKARHRTMNRSVAIKVLAAEVTRTAEARQAFQSEVRAAGKLSHPNIVTAYDANELDDRFYLVLEFVDGPSLDALVRRRGPLPVNEACEIVRQIAAGLRHAHEHGTVHRDLKPANVLLARAAAAGPAVKIADFGMPRVVPGAADYRAPEQFRDPPAADARADLYSLGCVFYFLLTGHPPFAGGTAEEVGRRHLGEAAPRVERLRPDVPPDVGAIVHRLLEKHPDARFASAAQLLAHLEGACVPVALAVEGVNFDAPVAWGHAYDSGYLSGRHALPPEPGAFAASPWEQLTDEAALEPSPTDPGATPAPPPHKVPKLKPPGHGESVPLWATAALLVGAVLLCLLGIGAAVRVLGK